MLRDVHIVIGTGAKGISVEQEVRLLKPALLYADRVTLLSPSAAMLGAAEAVGHMDEPALIEFVRSVAPSINPSSLAAFELYDQLQRTNRRSRDQIIALGQFRAMVRQMAKEWQEKVSELQASAGVPELAPAVEAGLLIVDPLVEDGEGDDVLFNGYLNKLNLLMRDAEAYPLFDDATGDLVRAGVAEGLFEMGVQAREHAKRAAAASDFISRAPTFPQATISEILDIRGELTKPLSRFRGAVAELARKVESAAHDDDFGAEVQLLYEAEVEPALAELGELVGSNSYLRQLTNAGYGSVDKMVGGGSILALGLMKLATLPPLAAASVAVASAVGGVVGSAALSSAQAAENVEGHKLYFLYREYELLS